ncbi:NlpC/P60 family protein [Paenibacillus antri]|uniref:NlpC/P60 family protein n=1 Tax=Paenibacillus antri TaxID=2582848 RepID=A0A5R9G8S7_9BACL|nr:NlpC/P60 family protein [Paenibacillus antri]
MKKQIAVALMIPALLFGTGSLGQAVTEAAGYRSSTVVPPAQKVIQAGKKYMGTPYLFGSDRSTTATFDCSDFVRQAFKEGAGIILPGNSRTQATYVKKIGKTTTNWKHLKPGDIMFFVSYNGTKATDYSKRTKSDPRITHNAIYLGNGKMLHTYSNKSGGVRVDSIAGKHWEYRFVFGGSAFK